MSLLNIVIITEINTAGGLAEFTSIRDSHYMYNFNLIFMTEEAYFENTPPRTLAVAADVSSALGILISYFSMLLLYFHCNFTK